MARKIGFIGIDKYDYILYLARVLNKLEKKVLTIDYSENQALTSCIPLPKGLDNKIVDYRGVKFTNNLEYKEEPNVFDFILIDYGFNSSFNFNISECDFVVCVTDFQIHNINILKNNLHIKELKKCLVIKDITKCKIKPTFVVDELGFDNLDKQDIFLINYDFIDLSCRILCQYDDIFTFNKVSGTVKNLIISLAKRCLDEIPESKIYAAYKKARKGE
jgi:hypothetical protein